MQKNWIKLFILLVVGIVLWIIPAPGGMPLQAWHMAIIFFITILGTIINAMPMVVMALLGLIFAILTGVVSPSVGKSSKILFMGFTSTVTWLVVFAFMIGRGFINTRLGERIAYIFIGIFGKTTLGLSYGLALTDLILAPAMPSITARGGGILMPIITAIARSMNSSPKNNTSRKIGAYLISTAFLINVITGSMFLTAMAGNPLISAIAKSEGYSLGWVTWFIGALVPGIVLLILIPLVTYIIYPPEVKRSPEATVYSAKKLKEMGPMTPKEWIMLGVFVMLLLLWVLGAIYGFVTSLVVAMIGVVIMFITGIISVNNFVSEKNAWSTFFWMSIFISLSAALKVTGFNTWLAQDFSQLIGGMNMWAVLLIMVLLYTYIHYFFASASAHVIALYGIFLVALTQAGFAGLPIAMMFAMLSNLFGGLTQYGIGSAPILFGTGYVSLQRWWGNGFIASVVMLTVLLTVGSLWWRILGWW